MTRKGDQQSKRRYGTGSISERILGSGQKRFDVKVRPPGEAQKRLCTCKTLAAAQGRLNAWLLSLKEDGVNIPDDTGVTTVRTMGDDFLEERPDEDRSRWQRVVAAPFIDWPVTEVAPVHIRKWVDSQLSTPIARPKGRRGAVRGEGQLPSPRTVQRVLSLLTVAFDFATEEYGLDINPCTGISVASVRKAKRRGPRNKKAPDPIRRTRDDWDYLREHEVDRILKPERLPTFQRTVFTVQAFTGTRPGELWGLHWENVDLEEKSIWIKGSYDGPTKNRQERFIGLLPMAEDALEAWWKAAGQPEAGPVFPSPRGGIYSKGYDAGWPNKKENPRGQGKRTTLGWRWHLGIRRDVPFYTLRHTCACNLLLGSNLFTGGRKWSKEEVAGLLGHSDTRATEFYLICLNIASKVAMDESRARVMEYLQSQDVEMPQDVSE